MTKVILLNGPPGVGKDTAAQALLSEYPYATHMKFAEPLKRAWCDMVGLVGADVDEFDAHYKEHFFPELNETGRQGVIALSESYIKERYGKDHFGRVAANRIKRNEPELVIFSDSGFVSEALPVINQVGPKNVILIRLHMKGKTFIGDSRFYINIPSVRSYDLTNVEGHMDDFCARVCIVVGNCLEFNHATI